MRITIASRHITIPRLIAPVARLIERFDDQTERQQMTVTMSLPVLGRISEYSGGFVYEIRPDDERTGQEERG